ncbi:ATP-dependent DNA helicase [Mycena chlorophos]|uniref:ATP-dependent DNA helicase n=1 Tax=Mycena chlorophos TaxID=658473 RepID=A0A8H6VZE0_MYCCL|nr:ATP-dependent DNA helicase [Mycena chlorophos]
MAASRPLTFVSSVTPIITTDAGEDFYSILATYTVPKLVALLASVVTVPASARKRRPDLLAFAHELPDAVKTQVLALAKQTPGTRFKRKRPSDEDEQSKKKQKTGEHVFVLPPTSTQELSVEDVIQGPFLRGAPDDVVKDCIASAAEHATYVPHDDGEDTEDEQEESEIRREPKPFTHEPITLDEPNDEDTETQDFEPMVLPLQAHGAIDVGGDTITDTDMFIHAATNLAMQKRDYAVRRGSAFINEYARVDDSGQRFDGGPGNPNHMPGTFPVLFPYGCGGFEVNRDRPVTYESHLRWALQYEDRRFRTDVHFMFLGFSVKQKRMVGRSANVQTSRSSFVANQAAFHELSPADFIAASEEEARREPISNPIMRSLRRHITTSGGMTLRFNPPTIWATFNFSDTGDPIAQVLAGKDIDLDKFLVTAGPDSVERSKTIAGDPFAAAHFFHFMTRVLLEEMFGITVKHNGIVEKRVGIVGEVNGYIGTVEAQARGTLHLHMLVWLKGAPTANLMRDALQSSDFREKMKSFISRNIRAHIEGTDSKTLMQLKKGVNIAYCRPEDPRLPGYVDRAAAAERRIARAVQTHKCTFASCLRKSRKGVTCSARAWTTAQDDWVKSNGEWGPKRLYAKINAWNPPVLQVSRSNHDMKLITNGWETKDITFYITLYIAKRQIQASNASTLLAKSLELQRKLSQKQTKMRDINKVLLQRCANTLSRQHEFSAPEVSTGTLSPLLCGDVPELRQA